MIIEFCDNEENIYSQTIEWLSKQLCASPIIIQGKMRGLNMNPYNRTVVDDSGKNIQLTAKEFDLLHFLFCHKGQVFTKEQIYEIVWGQIPVKGGICSAPTVRSVHFKRCGASSL